MSSVDMSHCMECGEAFKFNEKAHLDVRFCPAGVEVVDGTEVSRHKIVHADGCPRNIVGGVAER